MGIFYQISTAIMENKLFCKSIINKFLFYFTYENIIINISKILIIYNLKIIYIIIKILNYEEFHFYIYLIIYS